VRECLFGVGIDDPFPDRAGAVAVRVQPLLQTARRTFGGLERLDLPAGEPGRLDQFLDRGLGAIFPEVVIARSGSSVDSRTRRLTVEVVLGFARCRLIEFFAARCRPPRRSI
jgi:hypothetical protein